MRVFFIRTYENRRLFLNEKHEVVPALSSFLFVLFLFLFFSLGQGGGCRARIVENSRAWSISDGGDGSVASLHDEPAVDEEEEETAGEGAIAVELTAEDFVTEFVAEADEDGGFEISDENWDGDDWDEDDFEVGDGENWLPPTVTSVAVVPVGLTRFRPDLDELDPVTPDKAREVIGQVQALQAEFRERLGSTFVWLSDEWFVIAGQELPPLESYGNFPQIDNGVGSIRLFVDRFEQAIAQRMQTLAAEGALTLKIPHRYTWVVGNMVELAFAPLVRQLNTIDGLTVQLAALSSNYWGQQFTVTGLLTGSDLLEKLQDTDLGDGILLPSLMLKHGDPRFLDDMTVDEVSDRLGVPITIITDANSLLDNCLRQTPISGLPGNHTQG